MSQSPAADMGDGNDAAAAHLMSSLTKDGIVSPLPCLVPSGSPPGTAPSVSPSDEVLDDFIENRLYVSNIPFSYKAETLEAIFSRFGTVMNAQIVSNERGSKGFGFVTLESREACVTAMRQLDGQLVEGRKMEVKKAKQMQYTRARRNGGVNPSRPNNVQQVPQLLSLPLLNNPLVAVIQQQQQQIANLIFQQNLAVQQQQKHTGNVLIAPMSPSPATAQHLLQQHQLRAAHSLLPSLLASQLGVPGGLVGAGPFSPSMGIGVGMGMGPTTAGTPATFNTSFDAAFQSAVAQQMKQEMHNMTQAQPFQMSEESGGCVEYQPVYPVGGGYHQGVAALNGGAVGGGGGTAGAQTANIQQVINAQPHQQPSGFLKQPGEWTNQDAAAYAEFLRNSRKRRAGGADSGDEKHYKV